MYKADNLPPSCAVVTKSGNLNFLKHSGPLRACDGTALPLAKYVVSIFIRVLKITKTTICFVMSVCVENLGFLDFTPSELVSVYGHLEESQYLHLDSLILKAMALCSIETSVPVFQLSRHKFPKRLQFSAWLPPSREPCISHIYFEVLSRTLDEPRIHK